jgi:choline dehydrogenase-like flavoprotein
MHAVFPSSASIDNWEKLGNKGWAYKDLAPYYQKFGQRHAPSDELRTIARNIDFDESLSGSGPVQMSFGTGSGALTSAWMDAHTTWGFGPTGGDAASGHVVGAYQNVSSIDPVTKTRSYAASAYYGEEVRKRSNLVVLTETVARRLELEGQEPQVTVTGVELRLKDGSVKTVKARREVIMAAGVVKSPQILELSGIGGGTLLEKHGVAAVIDLPGVGENLQDHAMICQTYELRDGVPSIDMFRDPAVVQGAIGLYETAREGPLGTATSSTTYLPLVDAEGRLSTDAKRELLDQYVPDSSPSSMTLLKETIAGADIPALAYMLYPGQVNTEMMDVTHFGNYVAPLKPGNHISIMNALAHPFSRGTCHINSSNVDTAPTLDPAYLTHPVDIELMARSVMFADKLMEHSAMRSAILREDTRLPENVPDTLEKAKKVVKDRLISDMHLCGTCAMLPREEGGVVDEHLVVYGTRNLRVVDASIFPLVPLGNIQTTVYAVAEKAADLIREAK